MRNAGGLLKESPAPPGTFPEYDCDCPESARMRGSGLFFCLFLRCDMVGGGWFPVTKGGTCLFGRLHTLPLACFLSPIPRPPSRREGGDYYFISPGASPPAPLRLNPRGACSPCRCGTRRGACLRRCRRGGRWRYPAGACLLCRPPTPPLVCFLSPIPLPALAERSSPPGKGETQSLFRRGLRPRHPGIKPPTALTEPAKQVPSGRNSRFAAKTTGSGSL